MCGFENIPSQFWGVTRIGRGIKPNVSHLGRREGLYAPWRRSGMGIPQQAYMVIVAAHTPDAAQSGRCGRRRRLEHAPI